MTRCILLLSALLLTSPAAGQITITGIGKAADGDTLILGPDRIRLFGIDAPELDQACERGGQKWACGVEAKAQLSALVDGREVACVTGDVDDFGRLLARCTLRGADLNKFMVSTGNAVAFRRYSLDYVPDEERAKHARRGLWSGTFQMPSDYRQAAGSEASRRAPGANQGSSKPKQVKTASRANRNDPVRSSCDIKGNRNRKGQWIYHLPGMPYYVQTRAEQMFCSEAQAQAAGYRRAIVR